MVKLLFWRKNTWKLFKGVQRKNGYNYTICALHRGCLLSALLFQREKNNCLTRKQKRKAVSDPLPWPRPSQCAQHPHTLTFFLKPNKIYHQYMRVCVAIGLSAWKKKLLSLCKIYTYSDAEAGCALKIVSWWPMDNSMKQKKFPLLPFPTFFVCVSP